MESLIHATVVAIDGGQPVLLKFSDGTTLRAEHWSLAESGRESLCSDGDHHCSMPAPIDPVDELRNFLLGRSVVEVHQEKAPHPLVVRFDGDLELCVEPTPAA